MNLQDILNRLRHMDNIISKWLMQNFYYTFFHLVIVCAFFFWLWNLIDLLSFNFMMKNNDPLQRIAVLEAFNGSMTTFLLLLNSLWILYLLNNSHRIKNTLKNISYNTGSRPNREGGGNRDPRRKPDFGKKNEPR